MDAIKVIHLILWVILLPSLGEAGLTPGNKSATKLPQAVSYDYSRGLIKSKFDLCDYYVASQAQHYFSLTGNELSEKTVILLRIRCMSLPIRFEKEAAPSKSHGDSFIVPALSQ